MPKPPPKDAESRLRAEYRGDRRVDKQTGRNKARNEVSAYQNGAGGSEAGGSG